MLNLSENIAKSFRGLLFTALHGIPAMTSYEKNVFPSVRPLVRLSNAWFMIKRKKVVPTLLHHMKYHLAYFVRRRMVAGGTPSTWNSGSNWPRSRWSENADFQSIQYSLVASQR